MSSGGDKGPAHHPVGADDVLRLSVHGELPASVEGIGQDDNAGLFKGRGQFHTLGFVEVDLDIFGTAGPDTAGHERADAGLVGLVDPGGGAGVEDFAAVVEPERVILEEHFGHDRFAVAAR